MCTQHEETIFVYLRFIFRWQYIKPHDLKRQSSPWRCRIKKVFLEISQN